MSTFGSRLRSERARVGLSQDEFATVGGIKRSSQHLYEHDVRRPDVDYLVRIHEAGVDVGYLISGRPGGLSAREPVLTESQALAAFRGVDEFVRKYGSDTVSVSERERMFRFLCSTLATASPVMDGDMSEQLQHKWSGKP